MVNFFNVYPCLTVILTPSWHRALRQNRAPLSVSAFVPDTIETASVTGGIPYGMANVAVAQVVLDKAGINAHVGQGEAA